MPLRARPKFRMFSDLLNEIGPLPELRTRRGAFALTIAARFRIVGSQGLREHHLRYIDLAEVCLDR